MGAEFTGSIVYSVIMYVEERVAIVDIENVLRRQVSRAVRAWSIVDSVVLLGDEIYLLNDIGLPIARVLKTSLYITKGCDAGRKSISCCSPSFSSSVCATRLL